MHRWLTSGLWLVGSTLSLILTVWILTSNFVVERIESPLPLDRTSRRSFINLSWAALPDPKLHDIFLFISAYYDSRSIQKLNRPAISVIAYVLEYAQKPKLICHFTYANGSSACLGEAKREVVNHNLLHKIHNIKQAVNDLLLCPMHEGDPVPTLVKFSTSSDCNQRSLSAAMEVHNLKTSGNKIGVCLQGSLRQNDRNTLSKLDDFINMCKTLGADFITMYASPNEVGKEVVNHLLTSHARTVNLVRWKVFTSDDYFGQGGIMHDCLYRHMSMADYLVMIDLDEMILPFGHLKWVNMLNELELISGKEYAGYSFENRFFPPQKNHNSILIQQCNKVGKRPLYVEHTNELQCPFRHGDRSKYIIKPKLVVHAAVHELWEVFSAKTLFPVSSNVAVNAHYRKAGLQKCDNAKSVDKYESLKPLLTRYANNYCV